MNKITLNRGNGFTLIELLVVIAIIGVLATIVLASLNAARSKARDAARSESIRSVQTAVEMYYSDNGQYPSSPVGNGDVYFSDPTITAELVPKYIGQLPIDPINTVPYHYYSFTENPALSYAIRIQYENKAACYVCGGVPGDCGAGPWGLTMCQ